MSTAVDVVAGAAEGGAGAGLAEVVEAASSRALCGGDAGEIEMLHCGLAGSLAVVVAGDPEDDDDVRSSAFAGAVAAGDEDEDVAVVVVASWGGGEKVPVNGSPVMKGWRNDCNGVHRDDGKI